MDKGYAFEITRMVLAELYPEQLAIFEDWKKQRSRAEERGETGTAHTLVQAIPDLVFSLVGPIPLSIAMGIASGTLTGVIANLITDGPKQTPQPPAQSPPCNPDDETIKKIVDAIEAAIKAHPPQADSTQPKP